MNRIFGGLKWRSLSGRVVGVTRLDVREDLSLGSGIGGCLGVRGGVSTFALDGAPVSAGFGIGRQVDLDLGVREDDRADVASLGDDVALLAHRTLQRYHRRADRGNCGDRRDGVVNLGRANGGGDIVAIGKDGLAALILAKLDGGRLGYACDGVCVFGVYSPPEGRAR